MNLSYEFSKVKESFLKVKEDMHAIKEKINENYTHFSREHKKLSNQIHDLSESVIEHIENFKVENKKNKENISVKEILDIKGELNELKDEIKKTIDKNHEIHHILSIVNKNKCDIKDLKDKVYSSELEIFLLKERVIEKDLEIKQIKDVSSHMLNIIDELSNLEMELLANIK